MTKFFPDLLGPGNFFAKCCNIPPPFATDRL